VRSLAAAPQPHSGSAGGAAPLAAEGLASAAAAMLA
jgi:hypothetical protein